MRILITGKDGQVGSELARQPWKNQPVLLGRGDCDLTRADSIRDCVRRLAPDVIVNAAAYTAVDLAEQERDLCFAINARAPGILAEEAARLNALLIHYSTDYVFNGGKQEPYVETDPMDPLNVYGASKAAGEEAVSSAASNYLLLRTTWVYAAKGRNFLLTMLRLGAEREELRVVDDQFGAPTSANAIAEATARLISKYGANRATLPSGTYHMTAHGSTSWCGFARAIFEHRAAGPKPRIVPIASAQFPTPARRPLNSVLSNAKFEKTFGFRLSSWEEQMKQVLSSLPESAPEPARPLPGDLKR